MRIPFLFFPPLDTKNKNRVVSKDGNDETLRYPIYFNELHRRPVLPWSDGNLSIDEEDMSEVDETNDDGIEIFNDEDEEEDEEEGNYKFSKNKLSKHGGGGLEFDEDIEEEEEEEEDEELDEDEDEDVDEYYSDGAEFNFECYDD